jgi:hypothetical protein
MVQAAIDLAPRLGDTSANVSCHDVIGTLIKTPDPFPTLQTLCVRNLQFEWLGIENRQLDNGCLRCKRVPLEMAELEPSTKFSRVPNFLSVSKKHQDGYPARFDSIRSTTGKALLTNHE